MSVRSWIDQPRFLDRGEEFFPYIQTKSGGAQIIAYMGQWYLTVGSVFGSQTVKAELKVIGQIIAEMSLKENPNTKQFESQCVLIPNATPEEQDPERRPGYAGRTVSEEVPYGH